MNEDLIIDDFDDLKKNKKFDIEIIFLGEEKVGKTQIINQLINKEFNENYIKTFSANQNKTTIKILEDTIKSKPLKIYDLPGSKQFSSINKTFLKSPEIILMVYDITNIESFIELYNWNELLAEKEDILKCVIGNKNDLQKKREISQEGGKNFANKIGALFFEINAKDYINIYEAFTKIVSEYSLLYEKKIKKKKEQNLYNISRKNNYETKKKRKSDCFPNLDLINRLYTLKVKDEKKNINEDNSKDEVKQIKEIIKYLNGDIEEIYNKEKDEEFTILKLQNGDIFKMNKNHNILKNGLIYHKNMEINIYNEKIVNLITILLITNNKKKLNQDDSNEEFFEMDNNFVIKVMFKDENIIIDENILENVNVILFIFDEIDENYLTKIKSFYNKLTKIKKGTIILGIMAFKDSIKNKKISKSIQELSKSLNIFFEEEEKEGFDMKDFLKKIKNKYLNHYKNKIIENKEGTFFGKNTYNKKEGYGIMLYKTTGPIGPYPSFTLFTQMYFGEWEDNLKKGKGILYDHGNIYKGEWNNNELISGEIRLFNNMILEGKFLNSVLYEGKVKFLDFITYEGTLNEEYSYGKVEIKNGNIYEGKWEKSPYVCNWEKGEGTIKYTNNDVYKGNWSNFKKNGKGIIYTEDGNFFES